MARGVRQRRAMRAAAPVPIDSPPGRNTTTEGRPESVSTTRERRPKDVSNSLWRELSNFSAVSLSGMLLASANGCDGVGILSSPAFSPSRKSPSCSQPYEKSKENSKRKKMRRRHSQASEEKTYRTLIRK